MSQDQKLRRLNPYDLSSVATVRKDLRSDSRKIASPNPYDLNAPARKASKAGDAIVMKKEK